MPTCVSSSILRSILQAMSHGRHKDTLKMPQRTRVLVAFIGPLSIHWSCPRSPCPGSDKPPVSAPLTQPSTDTTKWHTDTLSQTQDEQSPATSGRVSKLSHPSWVTLVNHIPRAAKPSSAALLTEILRRITGSPNNKPAWLELLHFGPVILAKPERWVEDKFEQHYQ